MRQAAFALVCLSLILAVVLSPSVCLGQTVSEDAVSFLTGEAMENIRLMRACAQDDGYLRLHTPNAMEDIRALRGAVLSTDFSSPESVTLYILKDPFFDAYLRGSRLSLASFSPDVREKVRLTITSSLLNLILSTKEPGAVSQAEISFFSALRSGRAVVPPQDDYPQAFCLLFSYPGQYDILCTFTCGESGVLSSSATLVPAGGVQSALSLLSRGLRLSDLVEEQPVSLP